MSGSLPCFSHISASRDVDQLRISLPIFLCLSINTLMPSNLMTLGQARVPQGHGAVSMLAIGASASRRRSAAHHPETPIELPGLWLHACMHACEHGCMHAIHRPPGYRSGAAP